VFAIGTLRQGVVASLSIRLSISFLFFFLTLPIEADETFKYCIEGYTSLCNEKALSHTQLDHLKRHRSAAMLEKCKISKLLCEKEVLIPADLEKLD
jgi:hypothetical protein